MSASANAKAKFRRLVRDLKKEITEKDKQKQSQYIFEQIELLQEFIIARKIAVYWSLPDEVSTHQFIEKWFTQKSIYLPAIVNDDLVLKPYSGADCMVRDEKFGILQPNGDVPDEYEDLDLIIVPGVAFDVHGNRLGRGGGYYDRLLTKLPLSLKIGVAFDVQKLDSIPSEPHDIVMNRVIFGQ